MQQETLHAVSTAAEKTTMVAAGVSITGGAIGNFIIAYGGFIAGILGVVVVVIFRSLELRELKRHNRAIEDKRWSDNQK